ncbi:MAG: radical SAM protein [Candidatus Omnitrophica bacterium]|nr:radical SAM protein [Candidatus Omnitrophota bacterium]
MKPAVRFTWNMLYDCNYRCAYCFFAGKWEEYRKRNIYLSPQQLKEHWGKVYKKYGPIYLIITGGEPFIYPNFVEIIKELSEFCFHINISSNSSGDLKSFVEEVDPQKVSLSVSFHPQFDTLDDFIRRLLFIRQHKFNGCVNFVAYPVFTGKINFYRESFAAIKETLKIIPFFGQYQGKVYPENYTSEEREIIGINDSWFTRVKKNGSLCQAGHKTALVFPDGKVARCGQVGESTLVGNFFDDNFKLLEHSSPCPVEYCPCDEGELPLSDDVPVENKTIAEDTTDRIKVSENNDSAEACDCGGSGQVSAAAQINFTWDSHYKCNFRCPYCWFYEGWVDGGKRNVYLPVEEWMRHWKRIYGLYGKCHIAITGGEPFLYPNFIPLVKQLSQIHSVKITTNMSGDIETFVREIDPQKVILDLNFHPLFSTLDTYIKKTQLLKKAGFKAGVCYLAYPPQMKQINAVKSRFESAGINFALAAFWGEYEGRRYPDSYSQDDREMIRPFLGDIDRITYHLTGQSPKGKLCNAGHKYAVIQADGKVIRCGPLADKIIGSFFDEEFRLLDSPKPCEAETCPCNEYINLLDAKNKQ